MMGTQTYRTGGACGAARNPSSAHFVRVIILVIYFQFFLLIWRRESPCGAFQRGFYLHALTVRFRGRFWTSFFGGF